MMILLAFALLTAVAMWPLAAWLIGDYRKWTQR